MSSGHGTLPPTPKKLRDAKDQGKVAVSLDATALSSLLAALFVLGFSAQGHLDRLRTIFARVLMAPQNHPPLANLVTQLLADGFALMWPVILAAAAGALLGQGIQGAITWTLKPLAPQFDALLPSRNLSRLISIRSLLEGVKGLLKAVTLTAIVWYFLPQLISLMSNGWHSEPARMGSVLWSRTLWVLSACAACLSVFAALDLLWQRRAFVREQRMTVEELRRELKESEGDPEIKQRRKELAAELLNTIPSHMVRDANVVITNPTHYAVVLYYRPDESPAPWVALKGRGAKALALRAYAVHWNVPLMEHPLLARALYKVQQGEAIPASTYGTVALVLKWAMSVRSLVPEAEENAD